MRVRRSDVARASSGNRWPRASGCCTPVRYDADYRHAALDVPKLEAEKAAKKKAAAEWSEHHNAEKIAAADAALAKGNKHGHH
jgi:hypothetical protein